MKGPSEEIDSKSTTFDFTDVHCSMS